MRYRAAIGAVVDLESLSDAYKSLSQADAMRGRVVYAWLLEHQVENDFAADRLCTSPSDEEEVREHGQDDTSERLNETLTKVLDLQVQVGQSTAGSRTSPHDLGQLDQISPLLETNLVEITDLKAGDVVEPCSSRASNYHGHSTAAENRIAAELGEFEGSCII